MVKLNSSAVAVLGPPALLAAADDAPLRAPARTARGRQTRAALVAAARIVFEREGFLHSRLVDITAEAGVAVGTFYTHFSSREEAFTAVLDDVKEEMLHPEVRADNEDDPRAVIEVANRAYLTAYRLNALMEEVAAIDSRFMELRQQRADAFVRRNARGIRRLQERRLVDQELDPLLAAEALSHMVSRMMVSRMANRAFVQRRAVAFEKLVWTANRLWANALRLEA